MTLSTSLQILTVSYKCWQREIHTPLNVAGLNVSTTCMRLCCRFYRLQCLHTSSDPILDMWCQWLLQSRWVLGSLLRVQNTETPKLIFTTTTTPPRTETRQTLLTLFRAIRIKIFSFFFLNWMYLVVQVTGTFASQPWATRTCLTENVL